MTYKKSDVTIDANEAMQLGVVVHKGVALS